MAASILALLANARESGRKVEHQRSLLLAEAARELLRQRAAGEALADQTFAALKRGLAIYDASHEIVGDPEGGSS